MSAPRVSMSHPLLRRAVAAGGARRGRGWLVMLIPLVALYGLLLVLPLARILARSLASGTGAYEEALASPLLGQVVVNTIVICGVTTAVTLVLAYVAAAALWRSSGGMRLLMLGVVLLPLWTSVLVKNFAWAALLQDNGLVNDTLLWLGAIDEPLTLLHTRFAVIVGLVHFVLPYAVLPIFASMVSIDSRLERAAVSLGASRLRTIKEVILPLTLPGVFAAALLVLVICLGFFITPVVLGGPRDQMIANLIEYQARTVVDFEVAAALAMCVTAVVFLLVLVYQRLPREGQHG